MTAPAFFDPDGRSAKELAGWQRAALTNPPGGDAPPPPTSTLPPVGVRAALTLTTPSIASDAIGTFTVATGALRALMKATADYQGRLRLYQTSADEVADRARARTAIPADPHGCLLDVVLGSDTSYLLRFPRAALLGNADLPRSNTLYASWHNATTLAGVTVITLTDVPVEG